jgi:hypothetical protein
MVLKIAALPLIVSGLALADPIIFTIQGTGSGTVDSTAFNNVAFTFSVATDTSLITSFTLPGPQAGFETPAVAGADISIGGIGTGTFTDDEQIFVNNTVQTVGLTDISAAGGEMDLLDGTNTAFFTYDLQSSIGPLAMSDISALNNFLDIPTSLGSVTFTLATGVLFTATEAPVPEPATLAFATAGMLLVAVTRLLAGTG